MARNLSVLFALSILFLPPPLYADNSQYSEVVANSVGRLVLLHDELTSYKHGGTNPFGVGQVYVEFEKTYTSVIKSLPEEHRVDFFMSSMWHLSFSESYLEQFELLIFEDCFNAFRARLGHFIATERQLNRSKIRLQIAEMVLRDLDRIASRKRKITNSAL